MVTLLVLQGADCGESSRYWMSHVQSHGDIRTDGYVGNGFDTVCLDMIASASCHEKVSHEESIIVEYY